MDFTLHFCEYNRSNPDYDRIYRSEGSGDYLFLLLKTPMKVYLSDKLIVTGENACIFYTPGTMQNYQAVKKFRNSYVHFIAGENLGARYGIPENQVFYPQTFDRIDGVIQELQQEYISGMPYAGEEEYHLVCKMLILAARGLQKELGRTPENRDLYEQFCAMRLDMLRNYEQSWTTGQLCRRMNLGKSQLYTYYQKFFQSTPHADLAQVRLERAKNMLTNEAIPVSEVALRCGFDSLPHFSRYFRKECGCSPKDYRKRGSIQDHISEY